MIQNRVGPSRGPQRSRDPFFTKKNTSNQSSDSVPFFIESSKKSTGESSGHSGNNSDGFFVKNKSANNSFKSKHDRESNKNAFKSNKTQFSNKNSFGSGKQKNKFETNGENRQDKHETNSDGHGGFFKKIKSKPDREQKEMDRKFKGGKVEKRTADKTGKKPFDKKTWRLQKYSKKYKLDQWEDKRKKAVLREYYKEIQDDKPRMDVQKIYSQYADDSDNENEEKVETQTHKYVRNPNYVPHDSDLDDIEFSEEVEETPEKFNKNKNKGRAFKKARLEFERLKQEKVAKVEEYLKKKAEKQEAMNEYRKKKNEKYKKLNKKTKRGQPVMKDRLEMLLEKIQSG